MKWPFLFLVAIAWMSPAYAEDKPSLVFVVPATFYLHQTHLTNPRIDYWHNRGKSVERVGRAAFQANNFKTSNCSKDSNGQVLVVVVPNVSHNPQMGIFHTEVTAKLYSSSSANSVLEKPLLILKGQGQSRGWLSYNAENFIQRSYQQAFDKVIHQLQKNEAFLQAINNAPHTDFKALCEGVDALSQSKHFS